MIGKKFKLSFVFTILALLLFSPATVFAAQNAPTIKRLSGDNRYGTSAAVALSKWTQSDYVILAFGEDFPDALSAAPLAKKYNAPILLTETNSIPAETLSAIEQLKVKNIIIIGGTGVISSTVEEKLNSLAITVTRIFGQDRYETSIKIAEQLDNVTEIAIVTGESFQDALSISPIAAKKNMPIILVPHNAIPSVVTDYINNHKLATTYVIGSGTSLNEAVLTGLSNIQLITGDNKYQINLNIIDKFKSELDLSTIYITTGENFPDALSGSVLAGINSNPLVLVGNDPSSEKGYFTNNSTVISNINILGGIGVVTDKLIGELTSSTPSASINADSKIGKITITSLTFSIESIKKGLQFAEYKVQDQNGNDITNSALANNNIIFKSGVGDISANNGTLTLVTPRLDILLDSLNPVTAIVITGKDSITGVTTSATLTGETNPTSEPVNNSGFLPVAEIDFLSTKLTKTGANTATFKYKILDKTGTDITKTIPASDMIRSFWINSSGGSVSLNPLTGTGTITYDFSDTDQFVIVQLVCSNGISATSTLSLGDAKAEDVLVVSDISLVSRNLTKTGANITTFQYKVQNKYNIDITKKIPATQIEAVTSVSSTVTLDPSTATGTITYNSSTDVNKPISISLKDKLTGLNVDSALFTPEAVTESPKVSKINITSDKIEIAPSTGIGYTTYKVFDQYGYDITDSPLSDGVIFKSEGGAIVSKGGIISMKPNAGVNFSTLKLVVITGSDSTTGTSTSTTLNVK